MSLHLLDLDEPIEASFEEDFMDTGDTLSLGEEECKWGLEIGWKSWKYIGLERDRSETRARIVHDDLIAILMEIESDSCFVTFFEKGSEITDTCVFDGDTWFGCESSEHNKGPTFDIITNYSSCDIFWDMTLPMYGECMVVRDIDCDTRVPEKIYKIHDMWLDSCHSDCRCTISPCVRDEEALRCCHGESSRKAHISRLG